MPHPGKGRALGVGEVKFSDMVLPATKLVTYDVSIKRILAGKLVLGIADGVMKADGKPIYTTESMKVGLFTD